MLPVFSLTLGAAAALVGALLLPHSPTVGGQAPAHLVTMHVEGFAAEPVIVHVRSSPAGLRRTTDSVNTVAESLTVRTPSDVEVGGNVLRLEVTTVRNQAVRVCFTEGATAAERAQRPWGRALAFRRVDGELRGEAQAIPAVP